MTRVGVGAALVGSLLSLARVRVCARVCVHKQLHPAELLFYHYSYYVHRLAILLL